MLAKVELENNEKILTPFTEDSSGNILTLDSFYPIGYVYTQYPQQTAPAELFPDFTWTELNYDGAFFRSSGGNADAFISSGTLTPQSQGTAKNNLSVAKSGGVSTGRVYVNDSTAACSHTHAVYIRNAWAAGSSYGWGATGSSGYGPSSPAIAGRAAEGYGWQHQHSYTFTPSVSDNISATLSSTDTETRPTNYTIKVWVRTA